MGRPGTGVAAPPPPARARYPDGALRTAGPASLALDAALASIRIEPLREEPHQAVVSAHLAEGNLSEALRHYEIFWHLLRTELGAEPSFRFTGTIPLRLR
ncbi:BTAD domain-containing putative transcriptional regulator [Streptomyces sp. NPDC057565]|uniref:BTAD domain-containing putative transcriptional regulator n=1 Tax=Streptomyces sp. NPDC057565 TaxID=3346169 RepID=UPI0036BEB6F1